MAAQEEGGYVDKGRVAFRDEGGVLVVGEPVGEARDARDAADVEAQLDGAGTLPDGRRLLPLLVRRVPLGGAVARADSGAAAAVRRAEAQRPEALDEPRGAGPSARAAIVHLRR